ncbi:MAG: IS66 family transposase [Candidatus Rokuibacteriota bacterium]
MQIERITDTDTLRKVAVLLDRENRHLHQRLQALTTEIDHLKGRTASRLQLELDALKELLAQRDRVIFGEKTEKRSRPGAETPATEKAPRRGHGPRVQPSLPILDVIHELDEADRTCPQCGGALVEMKGQTEDSEEVTVVERRFAILKHQRKKYRCACNGCVDTAPGPVKLQPGSRYSTGFAVEVAVDKYLDHLPLERQARIMRREGLQIDSQTLWDQLEVMAGVLQPTYDALVRHVLEAEVVGADETWWRLMDQKGSKRWWVWSVTREDAVIYKALPSRSQEAARHVLNGYRGIVLADGYTAYGALARAGPSFTLAHCWAHVRRKFIEAEPHFPDPCREILDLIGRLYAVEAEVPAALRDTPSTREDALDQLRGLRHERSKPLVAAIRDWAYAQKPRALPESSLGKAIAYMLGLWPGLTRFVDDPRIPVDNNRTERGLRGVVLGRKNHHGSRSERGTEVAALLYSLLESAKLTGVEPKLYLHTALRAALENPKAVILPHDLPA